MATEPQSTQKNSLNRLGTNTLILSLTPDDCGARQPKSKKYSCTQFGALNVGARERLNDW